MWFEVETCELFSFIQQVVTENMLSEALTEEFNVTLYE